MERATFKAGAPYYEYHREGVYAHFDGEGVLVTNDSKVIEALSAAGPFITKVEAPKPAEKKPKPKTKK